MIHFGPSAVDTPAQTQAEPVKPVHLGDQVRRLERAEVAPKVVSLDKFRKK
jgi:hypothetical protein